MRRNAEERRGGGLAKDDCSLRHDSSEDDSSGEDDSGGENNSGSGDGSGGDDDSDGKVYIFKTKALQPL